MKFISVLEADSSVVDVVRSIRNYAVKHIVERIRESSLDSLDVTVRYIPIVMHRDFIKNYPARSKLNKKKRILDCCPQLNYEVFIGGRWEEKVGEYFGGLVECKKSLPLIGLNMEQLQEFINIVEETKELTIAEGEIINNIDNKRKLFIEAVSSKGKPDLGFYREALAKLEEDLSNIADPHEIEIYIHEINKLKAEANINFPEVPDFKINT